MTKNVGVSDSSQAACSACRFWRKKAWLSGLGIRKEVLHDSDYAAQFATKEISETDGYCQRYAPARGKVETTAKEWCGEFEPQAP